MRKIYFSYAFILILIGALTGGFYFSNPPKDPLNFEVKNEVVEDGLRLQVPLTETNKGRRDFSLEFVKIKNHHKPQQLKRRIRLQMHRQITPIITRKKERIPASI